METQLVIEAVLWICSDDGSDSGSDGGSGSGCALSMCSDGDTVAVIVAVP